MTALTDILTAHQWSTVTHCCRCEDPTVMYSEWPAHVEAAIQEARIAVVELPKRGLNPDGYSWNAGADTVFYDGGDRHKVSIVVVESSAGEAQLVYPDDPGALGAALLAAAPFGVVVGVPAEEERKK